jgi:hypothetical protein
MIERRFERRPALRIGVRVRDRSGQVSSACTRNLTVNGAFIETDRADYIAGVVVWVDLPDPEVAGGWTNVAALVVHRHPEGVGVMFSHPYTALERSGPVPPHRHAA